MARPKPKKAARTASVEVVSEKFLSLCFECYDRESEITKELISMPVPNQPKEPDETAVEEGAKKGINKVKIYHESLLAYRSDINSRSNVLKNQFDWLKTIVKAIKDEGKERGVESEMIKQAESEVDTLSKMIKSRISSGTGKE